MRNFLSQLTESEYSEVASQNIDSLEKLVQLLLRRIHPQNVEAIVDLLKQSLTPSISQENDANIDILFDELKAKPKLIFEKSVQIKIEKLTSQRFEKDKQTVIKRTEDISKLVLLMEEYFNEAIFSSDSGSKKVLNIREKIESIDVKNGEIEALSKIQNELINAASSIEEEMNKVTTK